MAKTGGKKAVSRCAMQVLLALCFLCILLHFSPDAPDVESAEGSLIDGDVHANSVMQLPASPVLPTKKTVLPGGKSAAQGKAPARSAAAAGAKGALRGGSARQTAANASRKGRWSPSQIVSYIEAHPSRAYFAHLFSKGGFRTGIEVGVADGRFSEHMLMVGKPEYWRLCEPFPNPALISRYPPAGAKKKNSDQQGYKSDRDAQKKELASASWHDRGIDKGIKLELLEHLSTDREVIDAIPKGSIDFVYLDGAHDYKNVKKELEPYWQMLAPGGVLAGHDYQNHGEKGKKCKGCDNIPRARPYTQFGIDHGKKSSGVAQTMHKVVKAVQEWVSKEHPEMTLHHTMENFTKESLAADGLDYDLVVTNTYNPSWFFIKDE